MLGTEAYTRWALGIFRNATLAAHTHLVPNETYQTKAGCFAPLLDVHQLFAGLASTSWLESWRSTQQPPPVWVLAVMTGC